MTMRQHATCLVLGETALLIRGPSGAGKSALAAALIARPPVLPGQRAPAFVRLVADDTTLLETRGGRLIARPVPRFEGLLEVRGFGIVRLPYVTAAVVGVVIDRAQGERLPSVHQPEALIMGVAVPFVRLPPGDPDPVGRLVGMLTDRPIAV